MATKPSAERAVFDRRPPQSLEAEQSVLGAMLLNPEAVGSTIEVLREDASEMFYSEQHQHIYAAMVTLFRNSTPVDVVTLVEQLTRDGALEQSGGASYVAELSGAVPTSANIEYYCKIVLDAAVLRRVISTCTSVAGEAYSNTGEVNALLDKAESEIFAIAERQQLNPIHKVADLLEDSIHRIEESMKTSGLTGMATGYHKLDEMLSGLQPSDMVILAARPSVGKTALALNIAAHIGVRGKKSVLLFSLEMAKEQLVQRMICMEGQIDSRRLRSGFLAGREFPKLQLAAAKLNPAPIYIDDTANISVLELRSKARRHAAQYGCDLIVIDYLQLMSGGGRVENRQVEISEISRSIKGLARELSVPVLALSQLSREAEKDDAGAPKLSHLRESGAIEQDADVVLMLSRPPAHEQEANPNMIRLDIAKQRNGPTGTVQLLFDKSMQRFKNLAEHGPSEDEAPPGTGQDYDPAEDHDYDNEVLDEEEDEVPF